MNIETLDEIRIEVNTIASELDDTVDQMQTGEPSSMADELERIANELKSAGEDLMKWYRQET